MCIYEFTFLPQVKDGILQVSDRNSLDAREIPLFICDGEIYDSKYVGHGNKCAELVVEKLPHQVIWVKSDATPDEDKGYADADKTLTWEGESSLPCI